MPATVINLKGISAIEITGATSVSVASGVVSLTVSGGGTPGGSNTDLQYNNSGAFGGFTDGTSHQVLHGGRSFSAVDLTADVTGVLPAANIGVLPAGKITTGQVALTQGGTGVDLSGGGSTTAFLAQDAGHVISSRSLVAGDVPNLAASKITTGAIALARGGTGVDLSATGAATFVLAQDASHVISARALIAADIPSLPASQITTGTLALARGGTNADLSASGSSTAVLAQDASHVITARALVANDIPNLPASRITSGVFATSLIPGAAKIPVGTQLWRRWTAGGAGTVIAGQTGDGQTFNCNTVAGLFASGVANPPLGPYLKFVTQGVGQVNCGYHQAAFKDVSMSCNPSLSVWSGLHDTLSSSGRWWLCFTDSTSVPAPLATDNPTTLNLVGFRASKPATDTTFKCVVRKASVGQTVVDSLVSIDTLAHLFAITYDGTNCKFYIDGLLVATVANTDTNFPVTSATMLYAQEIDTAGTTQSFYSYSVWYGIGYQ